MTGDTDAARMTPALPIGTLCPLIHQEAAVVDARGELRPVQRHIQARTQAAVAGFQDVVIGLGMRNGCHE